MARNGKPRVLVIGGYGVFGARLSRRLARHDDIEVWVGGRSIEKASAHCNIHGGLPCIIDTSGNLDAVFADLRPTVVVDAAGPFQDYATDPYRAAESAIEHGAHYLDLADDAAFVAGIGALNARAKHRGVVALSGCSSVPAISAAATRALSQDLDKIDTIEASIMPGNRAPRGPSVMSAILRQVGKPIRVRRGGEWSTTYGWCSFQRVRPEISGAAALRPRPVSPIGAPDLILFPEHFNSRTIRFNAGLELRLMHYGLAAIAWLSRIRLLPNPTRLGRPLRWLADRLEPFGTDRGAMTVDVTGRRGAAGETGVRRRWTMIAEAGDGPEIPPTPAYLLALRLCRKVHPITPGARPCLDDLTIAEIETGLAEFAVSTGVSEQACTTLFETALGDDLDQLPAPIRDLHDVLDTRIFVGNARVERGSGILARMVAWFMGFPPAADDIPVRVDMRRTSTGETWQRRFGLSKFRSHLSRKGNAPHAEVIERFGQLYFRVRLSRQGSELHYPLAAAHLFGVLRLPRFLLPVSETREYVDRDGNACFDVRISMAIAGFIVRYKGWLQPIEASASDIDVENTNR